MWSWLSFALTGPWNSNALSFNSTWAVNGSSLTLPFLSASGPFTVDWGDGSSPQTFVAGNNSVTYNYTTLGNVVVAINGSVNGFSFNNSGEDRLKLLAISQWGDFTVDNTSAGAFWGCSNLTVNASDQPRIVSGATMENFFRDCVLLNTPLSSWNTTNVTNMLGTFRNASAFAQNLGAWSVGRVVNCSSFCSACGMPKFTNCTPCSGPTLVSASNWSVCDCPTTEINLTSTSCVRAFASDWTTIESNETITFPIQNTNITLEVAWGDGTRTSYSQSPLVSHTYANPGTYRVKVGGRISAFRFNSRGDTNKITNIASWGEFVIDQNSAGVFRKCSNLTLTAADQPIFLPGASMSYMFGECSSFNTGLKWDTSNVTNMEGVFAFATALNRPINFTNTAAVTTMASMFFGAVSFDQLLRLDTRNVTDMRSMFQHATQYNQPINFDSRAVEMMGWMFYNAAAFNQSVTLNTTKVKSMQLMFANATSFDASISFTSTRNVNDMSGMFQYATSFNQPLEFDTRNVQDFTYTFHGASSFDQPLEFDTSNAQSMMSMFQQALAFNQPLNFNTSNVKVMDRMFAQATSFNQPLNFSTGHVISQDEMFLGATAFRQNLDAWQVEAVENCSHFCPRCGLPSAWNCTPCAGPILVSYNGWKVCNCESDEVISKTHCVTLAPTEQPTHAPTAPTIPTPPSPPTPPTSAPTSATTRVIYTPNASTLIMGAREVSALVQHDFGVNQTGDWVLTVLDPTDQTVALVARLQFDGTNGLLSSEELLEPAILKFPIFIESQYLLGVAVCLQGVVGNETLIPECAWLDTEANSWTTTGCERLNFTLTTIECSCTRLADISAILPPLDVVPIDRGQGISPETLSRNGWGTLCVVAVDLVFVMLFALGLLRDGFTADYDEDRMQQRWNKIITRPLWRQLKLSFQLRHTWTAFLCRKSETTFKSVDRIFVAFVTVYTCMTVSAYFHRQIDPWGSRLAEIALASTIALAPSQVFTFLFARSGPRGNFEEWEYQVGALRRYWSTACRLPRCFLIVWRIVCALAAFVMSGYIIFISLSFDEVARYYCAGNTVLQWTSDWVAAYFLLTLAIEPVYIISITLLRVVFEKLCPSSGSTVRPSNPRRSTMAMDPRPSY